jgi:excisionase family DNA binding protein
MPKSSHPPKPPKPSTPAKAAVKAAAKPLGKPAAKPPAKAEIRPRPKKPVNEAERDPMMTIGEVSEYLSLSPRAVQRLVGELHALRVDGRWQFRARDVDRWLLKQRGAAEAPVEPVEQLGPRIRLFSAIDERNIFLDVADREASLLIRNAIERASLALTGPEREGKDRIYASLMEREALCSTALHPDVAFPHPRDPEKCPLASDQIVVVRAAQPVEFHDVNGYRPRAVFLLLARTVSLQLLWEARLSHLLHEQGFVERILSSNSAGDLYGVFASTATGS